MKIKVKLEDSKFYYDDREEEYDTKFHGWDLVMGFLQADLESYEQEYSKISIEIIK